MALEIFGFNWCWFDIILFIRWWAFWVKVTLCKWMLGINIKKQNAEELEFDGPCVVVCNHQTAIDQIGKLKWHVFIS